MQLKCRIIEQEDFMIPHTSIAINKLLAEGWELVTAYALPYQEYKGSINTYNPKHFLWFKGDFQGASEITIDEG